VLYWIRFMIDMHTSSGARLNDASVEGADTAFGMEPELDIPCADQMCSIVTLDYLERRDRADRRRYSI